jgi:hypothetical protein
MGPRLDSPGHSLAPPMTGMGAASPLTTAVALPEASERPTRVAPRAAPAPAVSSASVGASWSVPIPEQPSPPWRPPSCWAAAGLLPSRAPWPERPCWEADTPASRTRSRGAQCVRG